jgi:hypothetical protein
MNVSFRLEKSDLIAFADFLFRRRFPLAKLAPGFLVWAALCFGITVISTLLRPRTRARIELEGWFAILPIVIVPLLPFVIIFSFLLLFARWQTRAALRRQMTEPGNAALLDQSISVSALPEMFHWRDESFEAKMLWRRVFDVADDQEHVYIFSTEYGGYIIPKRAFADQAAAQQFFETAYRYWSENRVTTPPIPEPGT